MPKLRAGAVIAAIWLLGFCSSLHARTVSPKARAIAKEATIYGFPLVDSYRIQYSYFADRNSPEFKAPRNYTVGLYRPLAEILNGTWNFPEPQLVS
jgi:hypothetical protein